MPVETQKSEVEFLLELGASFAEDALHEVLERVLDFVTTLLECDSCFIYILEGDELVLRASKNLHPEAVDRLKLRKGEGITGWVAEHREPVAIPQNACQDPRYKFFNELPEDCFEAFLSVPILCRGNAVGVINVQHRRPRVYQPQQVRLIATVGLLVGAEIEMARLEGENARLSEQLETRKVVERAKGILQRDLHLSEEDAYLALQRQSRQRRRPMKEIAEAIVLAEEVRSTRS